MQFSTKEKAILRHLQGNLPDSLTPFEDIANDCGATEDEVLILTKKLLDNGAIRRFGASLAHNKAGWKFNAMVAWKATEMQAKACAGEIKANDRISHAYFRPSPRPEWPYTFYTMIHGQTDNECLETIKQLASSWQFEYAILRSVRELKKTSPVYF